MTFCWQGCLTNCFITNVESARVLEEEGFLIVGCIPDSGVLDGKGWVDSLLLYKDLSSPQTAS